MALIAKRAEQQETPSTVAAPSRWRRIREKALAYLFLVAVVIVIGLPTALLFGLGDLIFESPRSAVITFIGTLAAVTLTLVVEVGWEMLKERRKQKR